MPHSLRLLAYEGVQGFAADAQNGQVPQRKAHKDRLLSCVWQNFEAAATGNGLLLRPGSEAWEQSSAVW